MHAHKSGVILIIASKFIAYESTLGGQAKLVGSAAGKMSVFHEPISPLSLGDRTWKYQSLREEQSFSARKKREQEGIKRKEENRSCMIEYVGQTH